ncbi:SIMPL domain-containing protein [Marinobacter salinisoli]|uniref:SIMPL domain-containing protein n=1 Tax=Marinobacter salinisoli TaxID=2769486 RepID=A0ABX7MQ15_9GAMM|nr:SIMPL domain-containing protein [Marinobacter salinisoli]QSP94422.1 SIMPL domain-containing protein [Marinobacter salinisoli]
MNTGSLLARLGVPLMLLPALALAGEVSLSGEGSVRYQPDSARLQFTAVVEHEVPQQATEQVAALMAQWRDAIEDYEDDLQDYTDANVHLYSRTLPPSERGGEPDKKAVASQTVTFEINDLSLLNPLLQQAQSIGLRYNLSPGHFFYSEEEELEQEALARAIADARARCEFVADQLGESCGDVISMQVNGGMHPGPRMMAEARAAADTVSNVGIREVTASVTATFELD